jgi:hypothetical protein
MYVVTDPSQIKNQVRKDLACGRLIGEEKSIDEDELQTDVPYSVVAAACIQEMYFLTINPLVLEGGQSADKVRPSWQARNRNASPFQFIKSFSQ